MKFHATKSKEKERSHTVAKWRGWSIFWLSSL